MTLLAITFIGIVGRFTLASLIVIAVYATVFACMVAAYRRGDDINSPDPWAPKTGHWSKDGK